MYLTVLVNILSLVGTVAGVLMHSGRGGGLSDMFGGAGTTALGSTAVESGLRVRFADSNVGWSTNSTGATE